MPADYWVKLKESKKNDKYQDLARELKKLWSRKVTVILIVIGVLGTVTKGLIKEMDTATRVQILDETDCISYSTNTLGKGMNPIILPPAMGK